jgi:hypothetical protein
MYGAEFYHWPLVDRQVISQMPSLVIASKAADYATLQVTDSCGDLRFVLRELAYCIERGSFQPTGWWAKFPVPQLRAKFIECLGCTVITWVCRGEIWQKERFSRTENLWVASQWSRLSGYCSLIPEVMSSDIICPVVCRFICEQPTKLLKYCKLGMELMRPFQNGYMCIWNQGLSKTEQERCLGIFVLRLLFHLKWNQFIIDWRRAQFEKLMAGSGFLVNLADLRSLIIPPSSRLF